MPARVPCFGSSSGQGLRLAGLVWPWGSPARNCAPVGVVSDVYSHFTSECADRFARSGKKARRTVADTGLPRSQLPQSGLRWGCCPDRGHRCQGSHLSQNPQRPPSGTALFRNSWINWAPGSRWQIRLLRPPELAFRQSLRLRSEGPAASKAHGAQHSASRVCNQSGTGQAPEPVSTQAIPTMQVGFHRP